jgi:hypothetical protein
VKTASFLVLTVLSLGACADPAGTTDITSVPDSPVATTTPASVPAGHGVEVVVTGSALMLPDGSVELCPPGMTSACPGMTLAGDIDPSLLASAANPTVVAVEGRYDGSVLIATGSPVLTGYPPLEIDFTTMCPDLRGAGAVNPNSPEMEAITSYAMVDADYAALWWDEKSKTFTIWFKGDDISRQRAAINDLAEGKPVCVIGGADYSEVELRRAAEELPEALAALENDGRSVLTLGLSFGTISYTLGGRANRVNLPVDAIDAATQQALADLTGDRVVPYPYIELIDAALADLPESAPAIEGDVDILTSRVREQGGMAALIMADLRYDPALNCVFLGDGSETSRIVPVWPFGYTATKSPMTVYDFDGVPVASEGNPVELGGGGGDSGMISGNTCGAESAWIVSR